MGDLRRFVRLLSSAGAHFFGSHGMVYGAAVAFNLLLSSIPVLFLAFASVSHLIGKEDLPFSQLTSVLKTTFPYGAQVLVPNLRKLMMSGKTFGVLGSLLLLLSSYSATDAVHTSLAVMQGAPRHRHFLRSAAFHMALVVVLTLLTFAAILVPPLFRGITILKGAPLGMGEVFHLFVDTLSDFLLGAFVFAGAALSYRYLSPRLVSWRNALAGSLIFILLLFCIGSGYTFYIKKFSRLNIIYGSLFSVVCFIIVAYLFAAAFLYCASIIGVLEREGWKDLNPRREEGPGDDGASGGH